MSLAGHAHTGNVTVTKHGAEGEQIPMTDDIAHWLEQQGLGEYAALFQENRIGVDVLPDLDDDDLKEIGIALGDRKRLLRAIKNLNEDVVAPKTDALSTTAERRQITVLFCDLVGSTALSGQLDPEDLRDVMRRYQDAVGGVVTRYSGHVAKYLGDGVLAYFGWPQAHEDQAERAVRAGLAAIKAVSKVQNGDYDTLEARVGIATGEVVVGDLVGESGRDAEAVTGETPNLAARFQGVAEPGQVIIGDETRLLVGRAFALHDLGTCQLKGFDLPKQAWRIIGEAEVESRFEAAQATTLTEFVGRTTELQLLIDRWELAKAGEGQVVLVSGDAGMGKSRLIQALRETVTQDDSFQTQLQASPYHINTPLYATVRNLRHAIGFQHTDDQDTRLDKLESFFRNGMEVADETLAAFADLFGLGYENRYGTFDLAPEERKDLILSTLIDRIVYLSRRRPFLFVTEDAHWGDPTAEEMIERVVARMTDEKILLIVTHRPEWESSFRHQSHVASLQLTRLGKSQGAAIIRGLIGEDTPGDIVDRILKRTDGIPLYIEELTRSLAESGLDLADENIPTTLAALLLARLDRLGPESKMVAQIGSAIGREFAHDLLRTVSGKSEKMLAAELEQLKQSGLIHQANSGTTLTYAFKHALVQDAVYQSLLRETRQDFHQRIADYLEGQYQEGIQVQLELLAHHYTEAGQVQKSVSYWQQAGKQAISVSSNQEAIAHLTRGRELINLLTPNIERDRLELDFCLALGPAYMSTRGLASPDAEEVYLQARKLCLSVKEAALSFQAEWGLWLVYQQRGQIDLALSQTNEVLALAETQKENTDYLLQAYHAAWTTELFVGNISSCQAYVQDGTSIYDLAKHRSHAFTYGGHDPGVCAKTTASEALCLLGFADQGVQNAAEGVSLAEKLSHPFTLAMAQYFMAQVHQYRRDAEAVLPHALATIKMCEAHGFESFRAQATVQLGWAIAKTGEAETGIAKIREGLIAWQATGTGMRRPYFLALLADALADAGHHDEGLSIIAEAETLIEDSGETRWQAETVRLKAILMGRVGASAADVEATLSNALEISIKQGALWLQLRVATSLARHWNLHDRADEASELLLPILAKFSESFDTPDLIEAKGLLSELT
ncbi:MAG: adenylate/guanylate cyclase domain-containing protein [Sneathiella sp.]